MLGTEINTWGRAENLGRVTVISHEGEGAASSRRHGACGLDALVCVNAK